MKYSSGNLIDFYKNNMAKKRLVLIILFFAAIFLFILGVSVGSTYIPFIDVCKAIFHQGSEENILIVYNIRLPRVIAAFLAGGGLAISGCIMQNVLKNDMASPSTLGVGNAAVFGANLAIITLGAGSFAKSNGLIDINNPYLVTIFAFLFALASVGLILLLARFKHFSKESIVLAGVAIGTIFQAGTLIVQFFSDDTELASAVFWSFGNLGRATYMECLLMFIVIFISLGFFMLKRWDYNAMANGNDLAKTLGVKTEGLTIISLLLASLITAVAVSFLGVIGFIGLISPQIMKKFIKDDFRYLIPASCLFGSCLLILSDIVSRVIVIGTSLPVGAITSLLGGPMFIYLLLRKKND